MSSSTHVICIVGSNLVTAEVHKEKQAVNCSDRFVSTPVPVPVFNLSTLETGILTELLHALDARVRELALHVIVPSPFSVQQRDTLLHNITNSSTQDRTVSVQSVRNSATSMCLAAFWQGSGRTCSCPNFLLSRDLEHNRMSSRIVSNSSSSSHSQRLDVLLNSEGVARVLVVEVCKEYVNISLAEVELSDGVKSRKKEEDNDNSCPDAREGNSDTEGIGGLLTVRLMSSCGSSTFGWREADIQFTAAQLAEVYATERTSQHSSPYRSDLFTQQTQTSPLHLPLPRGLFPYDVPENFLSAVIPALAREITRPFLNRYHAAAEQEGSHSDQEDVVMLRRLLWVRYVELELFYNSSSGGVEAMQNAPPLSLDDLVRKMHSQEVVSPPPSPHLDSGPASPSAHLPASIVSQLTWSPLKDTHIPKPTTKSTSRFQAKKNPSVPYRRSSTGSQAMLAQSVSKPRSTRALSGSNISADVQGSLLSIPLAERASSSSATLVSTDIDEADTDSTAIYPSSFQEAYLSPFGQFFRERGSHVCPRAAEGDSEGSGIGEMDLKTLLDDCVKKSLEKAHMQIIGRNLGLNSPTRPLSNGSGRSSSSRSSRNSRGSSGGVGIYTTCTYDEEEDMCSGWKTSSAHEDVMLPPRMVLLHIEEETDTEGSRSIYKDRNINDSGHDCPTVPPKDTLNESPQGKTLLSGQNKAAAGSTPLLGGTRSCPGVLSTIYDSLLTHSHNHSQRTRQYEHEHEQEQHESSGCSCARAPSSALKCDYDCDCGIERYLKCVRKGAVSKNVLVSVMNSQDILLGAQNLAEKEVSSERNEGDECAVRVFEAPLTIGIRVVPSHKTGAERSHVLWVSGQPPPSAAGHGMRQPLSGLPSLNIDHDHFGAVDFLGAGGEDHGSDEEGDYFYAEHIEKYQALSCRELFLLSDDDDGDGDGDGDDNDEAEGEEEAKASANVMKSDSCWRHRDSTGTDEGCDILGGGGNSDQTIVKSNARTTEENLVGTGLKAVFSGGFSNEIQVNIHFHDIIDREFSTFQSGQESNRHDLCAEKGRVDSDNINFPNSGIGTSTSAEAETEDSDGGDCASGRLIPPGMAWSVTEITPTMSSENKLRYGSEESYGSFLTGSDEVDMTSCDSGGGREVRHVLVEVETKSGVCSVTHKRCEGCAFDSEDDTKRGEEECSEERPERASDWRLEVLQYRETPLHGSRTGPPAADQVSVMYTLPFPFRNETLNTTVTNAKLPGSSNIKSEINSFTLDLKMDSGSGVVSCSLENANEHDNGGNVTKELNAPVGKFLDERTAPVSLWLSIIHLPESMRGTKGGGEAVVAVLIAVLVVVFARCLV